MLKKDRARIAVATVGCALTAAFLLVWLNVTTQNSRFVVLGRIDPPFDRSPDKNFVLVHFYTDETGYGWPWPAKWTYEVGKTRYIDINRDKTYLVDDIAVGFCILLVTILLPLFVLSFVFKGHRRAMGNRGLCENCGYDLRGNPKARICSECGHNIPSEIIKSRSRA